MKCCAKKYVNMEKKWRELRPVGRFSRESKCGKCAEEKLSSFAKLCRSWNLWLMLEQNWKSLIHFSASADNHFDPHKYSKLYGAAAAAAALGIGGGGGTVRRGWIRQASSGSIIFSPGLSKMTKRLRLKEGEVSHTEVKNLKYPAIPMKCASMICLLQLYPSIKHSLKVSRSQNKIVEPQILPKKEQRN